MKSITFVFSDGTVRTVPSPSGRTDNSGSDNGSTAGNGGSIGWLSDDNGIPCISGTLKSNASTYLPTIGLLALGTSAGDALTASQYTNNTTDSGGITSALTGNAGQAVMGQALGAVSKKSPSGSKSVMPRRLMRCMSHREQKWPSILPAS